MVYVELHDGVETKDHFFIRCCEPTIEAVRKWFHDFLEKFIRRVIITDSVISSIGAFLLMEFQNRIDQFNLPKQQQTALNILKNYIISKSITVIEHDDLYR